jgi:hypothetical protein
MSDSTGEIKLLEMKIRDFMGSHFAHVINPDPHLIEIAGPNRSSKTSILTAIRVALGGRGELVKQPVRDGAEEAEVYLDLGAYRVEVTVSPEGRVGLKVADAEGKKQAAPQTLLNGLLGQMWNPQKFGELAPKKQMEIVDSLVDPAWRARRDELLEEHAAAYEERTDKNRNVKLLGKLDPVEPAKRVDVDAVGDELRQAREHNKAEAARLRAWEDEQSSRTRAIETGRRGVESADAEVERLRARLEEVLADRTREAAALAEIQAPETTPPALDLHPIESLEAKYTDASKINEQAAAFERYQTDLAKRVEAVKAAEEADRAVKALDEKLKEHTKAAPLPDGLEAKKDGLYWNGRPLEQMSDSEGDEFAIRLGAALGQRIMLLDRGEKFDDLEHLRALAAEEDIQIVVFTRGAGHTDDAVHLYLGKVHKGEVDALGYPTDLTGGDDSDF